MQTENGAVSLDTTGDPRVNLFFKTVRFEKHSKKQQKKYDISSDSEDSADYSISEFENKLQNSLVKVYPEKNYNHIFTLIDNSWENYPLDTLKILYNWRDCRGGKGDRSGFFESIRYLYLKYPEWILKNLQVLPEYGRFLDLIELYHLINDETLEKKILNIFVQQIDEDFQNYEKGLPISLAAKWIPRENGKWDKTKNGTKRFYLNFCKEYRNVSKITLQDFKYIRKEILGPLKKHIKIVETLIVEKKYNKINYETVPSIAMKNYRKLFIKYDFERFSKFLSKVQKGESKINSQQLYPHDIINAYKKLNNIDIVLEEQWKAIKNKVNESKAFDNSLCVVDVSGSMEGTPMDVAIALGLLSVNETNNNNVITFHSEPELVNIKQENTLYEQIIKIKNINWGMNTNIERVFDLVFGMCIGGKNIDKIFIFSDMQFDQAMNTRNNSETHHHKIKNKFEKAGLKLPLIIYWNLRSDTHDFPVKYNDNGVILLSGYSPSLLTSIVNGEDINPLNIILSIINSERYNLIVPPE